ncbi:MAG: hypothetical protein MJ016_07960, partial [Victivallaceae bacterium]|nr:hypothetical protein [Victivallaceae bacterium]
QCVIVMPLLLTFIIFIICQFNWSNEIAPVLMDRVEGESFLNPFDVSKLRDFNMFSLLLFPIIHAFLHRVSGMTGSANSAISAHEGKMGSILAAWSNAFTVIFYVVIALGVIVIMNHKNFADDAKEIRTNITYKITEELATPQERALINENVKNLPPNIHIIGKDAPLSN